MGLVVVVVGVLAEDDGLDGCEGRAARPAVDVSGRGKDLGACGGFAGEEALEIEEGGGGEFGGEGAEPGRVEGVDFELQELVLFGGQFREPGGFVEFGEGGVGGVIALGGGCGGTGLGLAEEGGDGAVGLGLFGRVHGDVHGFALERHGGTRTLETVKVVRGSE